jgi:phosphatidylserine decarboxylase
LPAVLDLAYRGPNRLPIDVQFDKGQELGWFQHGSTILVFAPSGFTLAPGIETGRRIQAGQPLMRLPGHQEHS